MEKRLISESFKFYQDENDIDFKLTYGEHELLIECLAHCLNSIDFAIPLSLVEGFLKEDTLSYSKVECIENLRARLLFLNECRMDKNPYEKIEEYMDEEGHMSYITVQLDDN